MSLDTETLITSEQLDTIPAETGSGISLHYQVTEQVATLLVNEQSGGDQCMPTVDGIWWITSKYTACIPAEYSQILYKTLNNTRDNPSVYNRIKESIQYLSGIPDNQITNSERRYGLFMIQSTLYNYYIIESGFHYKNIAKQDIARGSTLEGIITSRLYEDIRLKIQTIYDTKLHRVTMNPDVYLDKHTRKLHKKKDFQRELEILQKELDIIFDIQEELLKEKALRNPIET